MTGLREVKRAVTSRLLAESSFRLAVDRGMDGFVIDEVTTATGYSRRTFANHFSCKEEAVAAVVVIDALQVLKGMRVESGETAIDALERAIRSQLNQGNVERLTQLQDLARDHPALRPYLLATYGQVMRPLLSALGMATGGVGADLDTLLLVNACYGIFSAITLGEIALPARGDDALPTLAHNMDPLINVMFARLRSGFANTR